ncbi:hypothetical protein GF318_01190 [Candidatus Micrarchaeota archaeon]|nr:hypothetical protein [Candidatus Micrarchaeota archaeon]
MIDSLKKSFKAYSKKPFLFVWSTILYIFMLLVFVFAAVGIFLSYFLFLSVFGQELNLESIPTLAVIGIIVFMLLFFLNGINASLARAYSRAVEKKKTSLYQFYSFIMEKAPETFAVMLMREVLWLLAVGPAIGIYIYFLEGIELMDWLIGLYALFMTFTIHMLFTPAFVLLGGFGSSLYNSLKYGLNFWREKHIYFIGLYILFAFAWLFNFIPFIQIPSLFFLYPVVYAAIVVMLRNSVTIEEEE